MSAYPWCSLCDMVTQYILFIHICNLFPFDICFFEGCLFSCQTLCSTNDCKCLIPRSIGCPQLNKWMRCSQFFWLLGDCYSFVEIALHACTWFLVVLLNSVCAMEIKGNSAGPWLAGTINSKWTWRMRCARQVCRLGRDAALPAYLVLVRQFLMKHNCG